MGTITLVSGGLDSTVMSVLTKHENITQYPLFINYGQRAADREWAACVSRHEAYGLPPPNKMNLSDFGRLIRSGLTDPGLDIYSEAFLPNRNLLFLLSGTAFAFQKNVNVVTIGLLHDKTHLFPDQTGEFLARAEEFLSFSLGRKIRVLAPLKEFFKVDVIRLAEKLGIKDTYSCHSGDERPCGRCISCRESIDAANQKEN